MRILYFIIILLFVLQACEDVPCTKDMFNPSLGIGFFERDSAYIMTDSVNVEIRNVELYQKNFLDTSGFTSAIILPILPDSGIMNISIFIDRIMRFHYDTLPETDTFPNDSTLIPVLDTIDFNWDTIPYYIDTVGTVINVDTFYLKDVQHLLKLNYTTILEPISQECGFAYQYTIDTLSYMGDYIDTVIIKNKIIKPKSIYDQQTIHIGVFY